GGGGGRAVGGGEGRVGRAPGGVRGAGQQGLPGQIREGLRDQGAGGGGEVGRRTGVPRRHAPRRRAGADRRRARAGRDRPGRRPARGRGGGLRGGAQDRLRRHGVSQGHRGQGAGHFWRLSTSSRFPGADFNSVGRSPPGSPRHSFKVPLSTSYTPLTTTTSPF